MPSESAKKNPESAASTHILGHLSGPVDSRVVYDSWAQNSALAYFGSSFLMQYFAVAKRLGCHVVIMTSHEGESYVEHRPGATLINRPRKPGVSGLAYHWHESCWAISSLNEIIAAGAKIIVLNDAMYSWWLYLPKRLAGIKFINALLCTLWRPAIKKEPLARRITMALQAHLHFRFGDPTLVMSPIIGRQVEELPGNSEIELFLPTYQPSQFADIAPIDPATRKHGRVHVLSAGRVERNKGVFDMLEVCEMLSKREGPKVIFHICGDGSASAELAAETERRGMGELFKLHGFCGRDALIEHLNTSDIVVVPTRTDFEEGFAMIVAEGVLARRPVVTSRVCPALELVQDAAVEVQPEDVSGYAEAIWRLATDPEFAAQKRQAAEGLREQFFDPAKGYAAKMEKFLRAAMGLPPASAG